MNQVFVAGGAAPVATHTGITWAPVKAATGMNFTGTSFEDVKRALEYAFGERWPIRLSSYNSYNLEALRGMAAVAGPSVTPYTDLFNALTTFGELEICLV